MDIDYAKVTASARHLISMYHLFLKQFGLSVCAYTLDYYVVKDVAMRYWRDVERIHSFHGIDRINAAKIGGYYAYWLSKLRPITVIEVGQYIEHIGAAKFINELFAVYLACGRINESLRLSGRSGCAKIDSGTINTLLYTMRYRATSGDNLTLFFDMVEKNAG
jgi:hypothetical protein